MKCIEFCIVSPVVLTEGFFLSYMDDLSFFPVETGTCSGGGEEEGVQVGFRITQGSLISSFLIRFFHSIGSRGHPRSR